jgi:hypothetical protein
MGGGGRWLAHVIRCLDTKNFSVDSVVPKNYHKHPTTFRILIDHEFAEDIAPFVFSGTCRFNMFLNFNTKFRFLENYNGINEKTELDQLFTLVDEASWRLSTAYANRYLTKIDIDYNNLYHDQNKFHNQFKEYLYQVGIMDYNKEFVDIKIDTYKKTCVSEKNYISNYDSILWIAWCLGLCTQHNIDVPFVINHPNDVKEFLKSHGDFFIQQTIPYII